MFTFQVSQSYNPSLYIPSQTPLYDGKQMLLDPTVIA